MEHQKGFSVVEVMVIVAIVILLGVAGWYVWKNVGDSDDSDNSSSSETTQQTEQEEQPAEPTIEAVLYSEVPADLQAAIFEETEQYVPGCIKDGQIVDFNGDPYDQEVAYASSGFAVTGIGCDGGAVNLFVKQDGSWLWVARTQEAFKCSDLETYDVPVELLDTGGFRTARPVQCLTDDVPPQAEQYLRP